MIRWSYNADFLLIKWAIKRRHNSQIILSTDIFQANNTCLLVARFKVQFGHKNGEKYLIEQFGRLGVCRVDSKIRNYNNKWGSLCKKYGITIAEFDILMVSIIIWKSFLEHAQGHCSEFASFAQMSFPRGKIRDFNLQVKQNSNQRLRLIFTSRTQSNSENADGCVLSRCGRSWLLAWIHSMAMLQRATVQPRILCFCPFCIVMWRND